VFVGIRRRSDGRAIGEDRYERKMILPPARALARASTPRHTPARFKALAGCTGQAARRGWLFLRRAALLPPATARVAACAYCCPRIALTALPPLPPARHA